MSLVIALIVDGDADCRYLTLGERDQINLFVATGARECGWYRHGAMGAIA